MTVAQGIATQVKRVKQSALGSAGSTGSQYMRRVTLTANKQNDTFTSNEIVQHQQSTGATQGPGRVNSSLQGELSPGTYSPELACILRKDFGTAFTAITSASLTIAASGSLWTVTRAAGSFLTDGVKKGMVVRLSVGTLNALNINKNVLVLGVTALVLTVVPLNGTAMFAEGPITGCTVSAPGKASYVPTTGHSNDYFTWEKWFSDVSKSELFTDVKPASADVNLPANGIPTITFDMPGLARTLGNSEVLTSPSAASSTNVLSATFGRVVVNGVVTPVTGAQFKIDGQTTVADPEVGSSASSDLQRGKLMVSGSFTTKFSDTVIQALREAQTPVTLILGAADSASATADFVVFTFFAAKIMTDDADDGDKQVVRTYNFTAQFYGAGGAGTDSQQSICQIHDSQAA